MIKIFFSLLISTLLFAYSDYDMDGVDDKIDLCPNTPFSDLVDINGCSIKSLYEQKNFDIILGVSASQTSYDGLEDEDTLTQILQIDYYYEKFSFQLSSGYYTSKTENTDNSGMIDTFLGVSYLFYSDEHLNVRAGAGLLLPTYETDLKNNNVDITSSFNASYRLDALSFFGGYSYTLINDDNTDLAKYQNTNAYNVGIGFYPIDTLYLSGSYNVSNSIYKGIDDIETISFYAFYSIDEDWFTTLSYVKGLSDSASDNVYALRLGYYF